MSFSAGTLLSTVVVQVIPHQSQQETWRVVFTDSMRAAPIAQQHLLLLVCGKALLSSHHYFSSIPSSPLLAFLQLAAAWNLFASIQLHCVLL